VPSLPRKLYMHLQRGTLLRAIRYKLGRTPPTGDTYYGDRAAQYDERRMVLPTWQAEQTAMKHLLSDLPDGLAVLDVPFGTGRFVPLYMEREMEISGLDGSEEMIAQALSKYPDALEGADVRIGTSTALPWPDGSFDLTVCFRFLSQIVSFGDAKRSLEEQVRVTRRYAIVEFAARDRPRRGRQPLDSSRLGDQLTDGQLRQLLDASSLRVLRMERVEQSDHTQVCVYLCEKAGAAAEQRVTH
jgi:ubiquinone/menaquinone biosynthesis C-methylase UbiE